MGALPCLQLPTRSHCPPPIDSIRDITGTGTEKTISKTSSIQMSSRISYERIAIIITAPFMQDTWRECIGPQERYIAFNI